MKEVCRVCARELWGNQRRWIFHPATKLNLQVLLSHALRCDLQRDGHCEFVCSKCAFMLDRMFRFDTVIARVEALSVERLHRLLQEKEHLRQCISVLYHKNNPRTAAGIGACTVEASGLHDAKYRALLQNDLMYSMYESWAEDEDQTLVCAHNSRCQVSDVSLSCHRSRRCRVCSSLRVADSDYEAVCKVPRRVARSISCGPSTRYSSSGTGSVCGEDQTAVVTLATLAPERRRSNSRSSDGDQTIRDQESSSGSVESLNKTLNTLPTRLPQDYGEITRRSKDNQSLVSEEHNGAVGPPAKLALALSLVQRCAYKPVQSLRGSKLPVLMKTKFFNGRTKLDIPEQFDGANCLCIEPKSPQIQQNPALELTYLEELWQDVQDEYMPICVPKIPKSLIEEQLSQLSQYECAAGQRVSKLKKAQQQVQLLQSKIHESEASNKKLNMKLCEMELEIQSIRQTAQNQKRTIQNLTESLRTKDSETPEGSVDSSSVVGLQSSLFSCQLQLEVCQHDYRLTQRHMEDLMHSRDRLQADLCEALQHRETTDQHNQDLQKALEQLCSELQVKTCELRDHEMKTHTEIANRDETISQLQQNLHHKDAQLQEYSALLEHPSNSCTTQMRDALLNTLRSRIRERDRALEGSIDEKFHCLKEKDEEVHRLQLALREKDQDLERLNRILNNNNETLTNLEALVQRKEMNLRRTQESCQKLKWLRQKSEEKHTHAIRERDSIINQLQTALHKHSKETKCFLQKLVSEQQILNESLRFEKMLYQNLRRIQCQGDSSTEMNTLDAELESLQALRRTLEEVLARTQATALDMAALVQTDYGGRARQVLATGPAEGAVTNSI